MSPRETGQSPSLVMYLASGRQFFHRGLEQEAVSRTRELCARQFDLLSAPGSPTSTNTHAEQSGDLAFYGLPYRGTCVGVLGTILDAKLIHSDVWNELLELIASAVVRIDERLTAERQLTHLNAYRTVSSMLAQAFGLRELLETALYCSMETVSAEAASVLLLDDDKKNFIFYQVEGPTKPILMASTFPADRGIAGHVLRTQQSEVINDAGADARLYREIDAQSNFHTRNMIVVPLTAGQEQVGILEVINKTGADSFSEEEHLLLQSIAEEISFAVRNAKIFEYVANSYCKQRQGQLSCKGCQRPLGSWTPCLKYREASL